MNFLWTTYCIVTCPRKWQCNLHVATCWCLNANRNFMTGIVLCNYSALLEIYLYHCSMRSHMHSHGNGEECNETAEFTIKEQLLTLGAHALRVTVGGWLCFCVRFTFPYSNELTKKTYGLPQRCKWLESSMFFLIKQPLHKATEFASKLLVQLSAILFALASTRAYILITWRCPWLRDGLVSGFSPLCLLVAIQHTRIS